MYRLPRVMRYRPWQIAIAVAVMLGIAAPAAGASSEIEHVWAFEGGEVAVQPAANGKLVGIVVKPTKFAECTHQAGEEMWTDITPQLDGSYWGLHQWFAAGSCLHDPVPGPTAWRVLHKPNGSKYLLVCFSAPGKTQPTIAPDGSTANWTFGCKESAPTAPLPVVSNGHSGNGGAGQVSFRGVVLLPRATQCVRRHSLKIRLRDPKRDPLKRVVVKIKKRTVADVRGVQRLRRGIVLKGLPNGVYTLKIVATTVLNQRLSGRRTYHSCGKGSSVKVPLHRTSRR